MTGDAKRCGTCRYWVRDTPMTRNAWGECRWEKSIAQPWWYISIYVRPEKTTEAEGEDENCPAWEAKP
jgi:hypothetical protein